MIKIKIRKIQADDITYSMAKDTARIIENDHKKTICNIHPNKTSYLILTIRGTKTKLSSGSFCCPEFKKTIKIK